METPRLRLLRLANLRGLLTPDYPHGRRSRIREELILRDLSRENEGQIAMQSALIHALLATLVKPENRAECVRQSGETLGTAFSLLQLTPPWQMAKLKKDPLLDKTTDELIKAHALLKQSKVFDILQKALEQ